MHQVNEELFLPGRSSRERVSALFGSAPEVVLKAVGAFLAKSPGELDHHNLRTIAAAAPHVGDPKLVAELIGNIPITRMTLAVRRVDISEARPQFGAILPQYGTKTRQRLVADLVNETTVQALTFSPTDRLTEGARAFLESHLLSLVKHERGRESEALASPLVTQAVVRAVLDKIEKRIDNSERPTDGRESRMMSLDVVGESLGSVIGSAAATDTDVVRAWSMAERCEHPIRSWMKFLGAAARACPSNELVARALLEAIDGVQWDEERFVGTKSEYQSELRAVMVASPKLAESVAREAVLQGCATDPEHRLQNFGLAELRKHQYSEPDGALLPSGLTSDEIEMLVAAMPPRKLKTAVIRSMKHPEALRKVSHSAADLYLHALEALIHNPQTPSDVSFGTIGKRSRMRNFVFRIESMAAARRDEILITDPRLGDERICRLLIEAKKSSAPRTDQLRRGAGLNPSAGVNVVHLLHEDGDVDCLVEIATRSTSPEVHRELTRIIEKRLSGEASDHDMTNRMIDKYEQLRDALRANGTLDSGILERLDASMDGRSLRYRFSVGGDGPDVRSPLFPGFKTYDPVDVANLIIDGRAPSDRIDRLVTHGCRRPLSTPEGREVHRALSMLADTDLLTSAQWSEMMGGPDQHVAMHYATHPNCPPESANVRLAASKMLETTTKGLSGGAELPPEARLRRWSQLPDTSDVPFPDSSAADLIDRQVVSGIELHVVRTGRELKELATHMGNCLEGYEVRLHSGSHVVATAQTPNGVVAIAWRNFDPSAPVDGGSLGDVEKRSAVRIEVAEMNTRFNTGEVPETFRSAVDELTARIVNGEVEPDAQVPDAPAEPYAPNTVATPGASAVVVGEQHRVRAPQRRRLDLGVAAVPDERRGREQAAAPSLLADNTRDDGHAASREISMDGLEPADDLLPSNAGADQASAANGNSQSDPGVHI